MAAGRFKSDIYWEVLLLMLLGSLKLGPQAFFLMSSAYFMWLLLRGRGVLRIPKVPGIRLYLCFILYGTMLGLLLNSFRNLLRDLYYILPTVVWIFIAYHLRIKNKDNHRDMMATLYLYGGVTAAKSIVTFLLNPLFDFEWIRSVFGSNVYDVGFILPILIMEILLLKKTVFSRAWDRILILVMLIQILLSFGRMALLEPVIELGVLAVLAAKYRPENRALSVKVAALLGGLAIVGTLLFYLMPDDATGPLLNKFSTVFTEINTTQEISSVDEAMNSWRAYEIQAVQKEWRESNAFVQLFGAGLGRGVYIEYVPLNWLNIDQDNEIPLLHNGFYSLLPKGGLVAVIALIAMLLGPIVLGVKNCVRRDENISSCIILAAVSAAAIANTYVVRGPVQQGVFLVWAICLGWNCKALYITESADV